MNKQKKKLPLAIQIFTALILAIVVGLLMQSQAVFAENYIKPFGTIFLNLLKFIVVPIVLFSIIGGIQHASGYCHCPVTWIFYYQTG